MLNLQVGDAESLAKGTRRASETLTPVGCSGANCRIMFACGWVTPHKEIGS